MTNILFLGDVFGRPGRRAVRELLPACVNRYQVDLVIANAENAAGGLGLTIKAADELFEAGADVLTSGNHIFRHKEIIEYLDRSDETIRPANYPDPVPGRGCTLTRTSGGIKVGVLNLIGRVFMEPLDCPFRVADREIDILKARGAQAIIVDMHAEATSEKQALGWYLDGRVGAVLGTHTHVQTADQRILPGGTAYISDVGMTGPHDSVIGMKKDSILTRFLTGRPIRFESASRGVRLEGVVITLDPETGLSENIIRIQEVMDNK